MRIMIMNYMSSSKFHCMSNSDLSVFFEIIIKSAADCQTHYPPMPEMDSGKSSTVNILEHWLTDSQNTSR